MAIRIIILLSLLVLSGCSKQPELISIPLPAEENPAVSGSQSGTVTNTDNGNNAAPEVAVPVQPSTQTPTQPPANPPVSPNPVEPATPPQTQIPSQLELSVIFAQQAPFGNWDALHEEACEEASMIMAEKYFKKQNLTESIMEEEIQKIVKWQTERGFQQDLTAKETVRILNDYYGLSARVSSDASIDRIKYEIYKGNLVIIPAAGRKLNNPNFKSPGPIYHMLVVKGYNNKEFITNDPGTRKGNSYRYAHNVLINAIHDWNHERAIGGMTDAEMEQGEKVIVIVDGLTN